MRRELFEELLDSLHEAGAIARGEIKPASITRFPAVDTRAIRENFGATQLEFSRMIGVSLATLRNWEQGRRMPHGPARILLLVVAKHPRVVRRVIAEYRAAAVTKTFSEPKKLQTPTVENEQDQQRGTASLKRGSQRKTGCATRRAPRSSTC